MSSTQGQPPRDAGTGTQPGTPPGGAQSQAEQSQEAERQYVPSTALALVTLGLGNKSAALDLLDRAFDEHDFSLVFLEVEPWFEQIRGEPRFQQLLRRMQSAGRPTP